MPFDMKALDKPARFFWPGDEKGEEWVDLRALTDKEQIALMRECGMEVRESFQPNPYSKKVEHIDYIPANLDKLDAFLDKVWDMTIADWNLATPDGKKIPCTPENKTALMSKSDDFRRWVDECVAKIRPAREERRKELEKNSSGSQRG